MTREEIEKKADNAFPSSDKLGLVVSETTKLRREGYIKCAEEYESLPTIHGWVARDKDGSVHAFRYKPVRGFEREIWVGAGLSMDLPKDSFLSARWESEPVEVKMLIQKITK